MSTSIQDYEQMKLCAYRWCWAKRKEKNSRGLTWAAWWNRMFNDDIQSYHAQRREMAQKKALSQHRALKNNQA